MDKIRPFFAGSKVKPALLFLGLGILAQSSLQASPSPPGINLISCDRTGALIELQLPEFYTQTLISGGQTFTDLRVPGWGRLALEGKPALPQVGFWLALPPGARATLSVESVQTRSFPLDNPLPAPTWQTDRLDQSPVERYIPDPAVYASSSPFPSDWATLGEPAWLRNFWVIPVRLTPFKVYAGRGEALVADRMRLRLTFRGGLQGRYIPDPHGEALARSLILNVDQANAWQERGAPPKSEPAQTYGQYKLLVEHDGLYSITYSDLIAAGIDPDAIDPQTLKIYLEGQQIPIWVEGEWDGIFHPEDYILFFGNFARGTYTYENIYTRKNVYWLDWGGDPGLRLGTSSVAPDTVAPQATAYMAYTRTEVDTSYQKFGYANLAEDIDHWMWLKLDEVFNPAFSYLLNLPGLQKLVDRTYELAVSVRGYTLVDTIDPDHRLTVQWNENPTIDVIFDGQNALVATADVPWSYIRTEEPNELVISAPSVPDVFSNAFFLDWIKVGYWRDFSVQNDTLLFQSPQDMGHGKIRYQLTGLQDPQVELWNLTRMDRLVNFQYENGHIAFVDSASDTTCYFVAGQSRWLTPEIVEDEPSTWKSPSHGVDYLIITHEDFYPFLDPLISRYESLGFRVERAKVGDIYDEFSYGLKNPQAIFDFVQYAYFNYQDPPLSYILLVGDASWDYKDNDPQPYVDYVPSHAIMTYKWGETASDNWFAAVSGLPDPLPDCHIGRFPVNNQEELDLLIQKSLTYETAPPPGYWRSQVIFSNGAYGEEDAALFDASIQTLIDTYFPEWYDPPRIYSRPSPGYEQYQGDSLELIQTINLGAALVNYRGHAANQMWETLSTSNIGSLTNGDKLPFVVAFSCFTGIFSNTRGFGEAFILQPGGGAIAYFSNGTVGYTTANNTINDILFQNLFSDTLANPTFGQAVTGAKWSYYAYYGNNDPGMVVSTYCLLGDPGLTFIFEDPDPADTLDNSPPWITFTVPGYHFRDGDYIENPVSFICEIYDSTEIDLTTWTMELTRLKDAQGNSVGETILEWAWPDTLAPGFEFTLNPPGLEGHRVQFTFTDSLSSGEWSFSVSVADLFLQGPASDSLKFLIAGDQLVLEQPLNYPNPFRDHTCFTFTLSQSARTTIKVYTVSGKLIWVGNASGNAGYNIYEWDGRDQQGDPLSNGTYIYKVIARRGDQQVEKVEKMIKIR